MLSVLIDLGYSCVTLDYSIQKSVQPAKMGFGASFLKLKEYESPLKAL